MIKEDLHLLPKIYTEIQSWVTGMYATHKFSFQKKITNNFFFFWLKKLPTILRADINSIRYA